MDSSFCPRYTGEYDRLEFTSFRNLTGLSISTKYVWYVPHPAISLPRILNFTQYDMLGTTGGCQATYTVIPPSDPILPSNCTNVTLVPQLDVDARDHTGPLSRFGFTDQVRHFMRGDSLPLIIKIVHGYLHHSSEWSPTIHLNSE